MTSSASSPGDPTPPTADTAPPPQTEARRSGRRGFRANVLMAAAAFAGISAVVVFVCGVIVTAGVYGSRMAWLLGVVLPLLGLTALCSWLASRSGASSSQKGKLRIVALVALGMIGTPFVLAGLLLSVYLLGIILYELGHLFS